MQGTKTCTYAIDQFKAGPDDFRSIIGSGNAYTDATFPKGYSGIRWTEYPQPTSLSLSYQAQYSSWYRPTQIYTGLSLFGPNGIKTSDVF